jgi:DNA adenine methylase
MKPDAFTMPSAPSRPVLRYHGGKWKLAPWVLQHFPKHGVYVEPFAGAASILMRKPRVAAEVYNDLDDGVVSLFRILRDPARAAELRRLVELTPFARSELEWAMAPAADDMEAAHKLILRSFLGRGSDAATRTCRVGFSTLLSEERALPAAAFSKWPEAIATFTDRLRGVVIENRPAVDVIRMFDTPNTLIYADPPYLTKTRSSMVGRGAGHGYKHEMDDEQHVELATVLRSAKGMVLLSAYPSDLYEELYLDWDRVSTGHRAEGSAVRTEVLWINPACAAALELQRSQGRMFA